MGTLPNGARHCLPPGLLRVLMQIARRPSQRLRRPGRAR